MESFAARSIRQSPPRTVFSKQSRAASATTVTSTTSYRGFYSTPSKSHRLSADAGRKQAPRSSSPNVSAIDASAVPGPGPHDSVYAGTSTLVGRRSGPQGRQPQGTPGAEPWVQPPFQKVSTLKIAPSADSVGLFG